MTRSRIFLAGTGWFAFAAATLLPPATTLRVVIAVGFIGCCPGAAVLSLARRTLRRHGRSPDGLEAATLVVALSLALGALVSEAFFLTGAFTVLRCTAALAALTSVAALWPTAHAGSSRALSSR